MIYDKHGTLMARSRPSFVMALIPSEVTDVKAELDTLAEMIGTDRSKLWARLLHHRGITYASFDEVVASEPYGPVVLVSDLPVAAVARVSEVLTALPGVDLEVQPTRDYPHGTDRLASRRLRRRDQRRRVRAPQVARLFSQRRHRERRTGTYRTMPTCAASPAASASWSTLPARWLRVRALPAQAAVPGDTLFTNIDWRLQRIADEALEHGIRSWGHGRRLSGAVVAEDPWTGGILAVASYPNFDPNDFVANRWKRIAFDLTDPAEPLFDRAIAAATPTGSTFKMVTGSAALTEGVVKVNQVVNDTGGWNCGGYYARDIAAGGLGNTTFIPALAASSDGYFFRLSWWLGNERLRRYALAFGLNAKTGIDLPGENEGNWPTNAWEMRNFGVPMEPSDSCFLGIGQGAMQATPLQMTNVASAVINGGTLYKPQIVREIRNAAGVTVKRFTPQVIRQVPVTQSALAAVREGMARVTDPGGTAYGLAIDGLPFSGKTGTAETAGGNGPNTTWFIAWAPTRHPRVALAVFVDRSGGYGASVAAPIAREILVKYFNVKG